MSSSVLDHNPDEGFWALSRHADVIDAFRDPARFSPPDPRRPALNPT